MTVEAPAAWGRKDGEKVVGGMALHGGPRSSVAVLCQGGWDLEEGKQVPGTGHWFPVGDAAELQGAAPALHAVGCIREALEGPGWLTWVLEAASCTCRRCGRCQQRGVQQRLQLGEEPQPSSRCGPWPGTSARCG